MNLEPKGIAQYAKMGFMALKAGKGAFSLIRRHPLHKHKKKKLQMRKNRIQQRHQRDPNAFFSARKGVCKRIKIGRRALLILKERYL